jgi:hypothetical protein
MTAGVSPPADLPRHRNGRAYIRRSVHVPPTRDAVRKLMPDFLELLTNEAGPAVRVLLGNFMSVYIQLYMDGNGRMGCFLVNTMMAAGGYPWMIIPVDRRDDNMAALESVVEMDARDVNPPIREGTHEGSSQSTPGVRNKSTFRLPGSRNLCSAPFFRALQEPERE